MSTHGSRQQSEERHAQTTHSVAVELPEEEAMLLLREGEIIDGQRIPWSSNHTFLVRIDAGPGRHLRAVYKPRDGERPLFDFPRGSLYKREYAAYLLSRSLGWPSVPPTLIREGPHGVGALQLYVASDQQITYFDLIADSAEELLPFAVFDVVANNADRKGGHCLLGGDKRIWSIDHGLTFHPEFKLRTVMMEFWGAPIPRHLLDSLEALGGLLGSRSDLAAGLAELLSDGEIGALRSRLDSVLEDPQVPRLDPRWNVPWPLE